MPDHPCYNDLCVLRNDTKKKTHLSFSIRANSIARTYEIDLANARKSKQTLAPPWTIPELKCNLQLTALTKKQTLPSVLRENANELIRTYYTGYDKIYTDGSVMNEGVGCAFHSHTIDRKFKLPDGSSIFSAELYALKKALNHIHQQEMNHVAIFTDSLSVLHTINEIYSKSPLINEVKDELKKCEGKDLEIVWVPSHVGISGNEEVDKLARESVSTGMQEDMGLSREELRAILKGRIKDEWKREWQTSRVFLRRIKNDVDRWVSIDHLSRRDQVVMNRLRTGHTTLTHSYLMEGSPDPPICEACSSAALSVRHVVSECKFYEGRRKALGINMGYLANDMGKNQKLIEYLKEINVFDRI